MTLGMLALENCRIIGGGQGFLTIFMSRAEVTLKVQGWYNLEAHLGGMFCIQDKPR